MSIVTCVTVIGVQKNVVPIRIFFVIFLSKPINMGSSFKDLDAKNLIVKMVRDLDAQFKR